MRSLRLSRDDVATIIESHEWHESQDDGREVAWVRFEGEYLKVVYAIEGDVRVVITVGKRPRLSRGLR